MLGERSPSATIQDEKISGLIATLRLPILVSPSKVGFGSRDRLYLAKFFKLSFITVNIPAAVSM